MSWKRTRCDSGFRFARASPLILLLFPFIFHESQACLSGRSVTITSSRLIATRDFENAHLSKRPARLNASLIISRGGQCPLFVSCLKSGRPCPRQCTQIRQFSKFRRSADSSKKSIFGKNLQHCEHRSAARDKCLSSIKSPGSVVTLRIFPLTTRAPGIQAGCQFHDRHANRIRTNHNPIFSWETNLMNSEDSGTTNVMRATPIRETGNKCATKRND
jgi:hypothetical protein